MAAVSAAPLFPASVVGSLPRPQHVRELVEKAAWDDADARAMDAAIRDAVARIRSMQGDLWPSVLDDIGILATINWYCREFEKDHSGLIIENQ